MMEKILRLLFDYQKFEDDPGLSSVIEDTHNKYNKEKFRVISLTDDSLSEVSAAGEYVQGQPSKPLAEMPFACESRDDNDNNDSNI